MFVFVRLGPAEWEIYGASVQVWVVAHRHTDKCTQRNRHTQNKHLIKSNTWKQTVVQTHATIYANINRHLTPYAPGNMQI